VKRKDKEEISDEMIGSDQFGDCCSTVADKMIIAGNENTGGEDVTGESAMLSETQHGSSTVVEKTTK
jgi:hypothetical protein